MTGVVIRRHFGPMTAEPRPSGAFNQFIDYRYFGDRDPVWNLECVIRSLEKPYVPEGWRCLLCGDFTEETSDHRGDPQVSMFCELHSLESDVDLDGLCDACCKLDLSMERPHCELGCNTEPLVDEDFRFCERISVAGEAEKKLEAERERLLQMIRPKHVPGQHYLHAGLCLGGRSRGVVSPGMSYEPCTFIDFVSDHDADTSGLQTIGTFGSYDEAEIAGKIDASWRRAGLPRTTVEVAAALGLNSILGLAQVPFADLLPYLISETST